MNYEKRREILELFVRWIVYPYAVIIVFLVLLLLLNALFAPAGYPLGCPSSPQYGVCP